MLKARYIFMSLDCIYDYTYDMYKNELAKRKQPDQVPNKFIRDTINFFLVTFITYSYNSSSTNI